MTKAELIEAVADSAGVSKADAERTVTAFFDTVVAEIEVSREVQLLSDSAEECRRGGVGDPFNAIFEPGQQVTWTYRRGGERRTTTATAGQRPDMPPPPPPAPEPDAEPLGYTAGARAYSSAGTTKLRYSGLVGETSVEVRGTGSVVVNIIEAGREIEIVTSDSRTRIRMDDPK